MSKPLAAFELLNGHKPVKPELLGDEKTLFPNMPETLKAAETVCGIAVATNGRLCKLLGYAIKYGI